MKFKSNIYESESRRHNVLKGEQKDKWAEHQQNICEMGERLLSN